MRMMLLLCAHVKTIRSRDAFVVLLVLAGRAARRCLYIYFKLRSSFSLSFLKNILKSGAVCLCVFFSTRNVYGENRANIVNKH